MFANEPIEARETLLHDNCDQIVERSYTRAFSQSEMSDRRVELEQVSIQLAELENELKQVRADYKGRMTPIRERRDKILDELKARGEWVSGNCFKFIDPEEGKTAFYSPEGFKLEERPCTPEERQRTVLQAVRFGRTGTDD